MKKEIKNNSFVFYATSLEAVEKISEAYPEMGNELLKAIVEYGIYGEYDKTNPIIEAMMVNISFGIDKAKDRYNGSTLVNTFKHNDSLISINIQRVGEANKFFGFSICQRLNFHLRDLNREISVSAGQQVKVYIDAATFPTFQVTEVNRDENTNELSITAYDALYGAAAHLANELTLEPPYTTLEFVDACANLIGVSVQAYEDQLFGLSYPEGINIEGSETIRELVNAACEATLSIAFLNNENKLVFKRFSNDAAAALAITKEKYFTLSSGSNRRLTKIVSATELGDNVSAETTQIGTVQIVRDNPFWVLREDIDEILNYAISAVGNLTINQFECDWRGNAALEVGDKISLTTKDNELVYSYVLDDEITYNGGLQQKTKWRYEEDETETEDNPVGLGDKLKQTFAKVDKANKEIVLQAENLSDLKETTNDSLAALKVKSDEISGSVSKIEEKQQEDAENLEVAISQVRNEVNTKITPEEVQIQITEALSDGVTSVDTGTGFTFNQDGLTIKKANSEMKTKIDEDGMRVYRENEEVLTANNEGVNAINLTSRQYLIIGQNSRLEDYQSNRTACFYIGG